MSSRTKLVLVILAVVLLTGAGAVYYALKTGKLKFGAQEVSTQGPNVEVRDNKIYVNGQYIFPIGLWGVPSDTVFTSSLNKLPLTGEELKSAGFNVLTPADPVRTTTPREEDEIIEGLYRFVFIQGKDGLESVCQTEAPSSGDDPCLIRQIIKNNLSRTDIIGWFGADEPGIIKEGQEEPISPEALVAGYNIAKATDPLKRPIWINQGPRGTAPDSNWSNYDSLLPYNSALDIFSTHIFPVPPKGDMSERYQNKNISMVGEVVDILKQIANKDKKRPFWMFLQGANKEVWHPNFTDPIYDEKPSFEQQRFMAYDAIIHGTDGLFWFGVWGLSKGDPALQAILDAVKEINQNLAVITAPKSSTEIKVSTPSYTAAQEGESPIHLAIKRLNDKDYIIATNNVDEEIEATFEVPVSKVLKYQTNEELAGAGDNFKISFAPFGVEILEIVPAQGGGVTQSQPTAETESQAEGTSTAQQGVSQETTQNATTTEEPKKEETKKEELSGTGSPLTIPLATAAVLSFGYAILRRFR